MFQLVGKLVVIVWCFSDIYGNFLTFKVLNGRPDGRWIFQDGSYVTLVCSIRPYLDTAIVTFLLNSKEVFACTGSLCESLDDDQGAFSFEHDIDEGTFTWKINKVTKKYDQNEFTCYSGKERRKSYIATVIDHILIFEVQNSLDGNWAFENGSAVTLVCTSRPYIGIMDFQLNYHVVFVCSASFCKSIDNDQEAFSFEYDLNKGIFFWKIHTVTMNYDKNNFTCCSLRECIRNVITVTRSTITEDITRRKPLLYLLFLLLLIPVVLLPIVVWWIKRNGTPSLHGR